MCTAGLQIEHFEKNNVENTQEKNTISNSRLKVNVKSQVFYICEIILKNQTVIGLVMTHHTGKAKLKNGSP